MLKKIIFLLALVLTAGMGYADVTLSSFMEGGFQLYTSQSGSIVSNAVWNTYPYSGDNRYGYYQLNMGFLNLAGWTGWGNMMAEVNNTADANRVNFANYEMNFTYRPKGISFAVTKNQNWTWLGQPFLSIYGDKDRNDKTVALFFEAFDIAKTGLHFRSHAYNASTEKDYLGLRLDQNYKIGTIVSGGWGFTGSLARFVGMSNNYVDGAAVDFNMNISAGPANIYFGTEAARLDEPWRGVSNNGSMAILFGANDAYAWHSELKTSLPTDFGNFSLNSSVEIRGTNFDGNDQFGGTAANWYEEFLQFNYAFPLKAIDFTAQLRYSHRNFVSSASYGSPTTPTQVMSNTNWIWGYHFWDYYANVPIYGGDQTLEYYTKIFVQLKKGIKFSTSYQYFAPGLIKLWGNNGSGPSTNGNDALKLDLNFENELGKIDLQYKVYRLTYPDPRFRIDAGGLELLANISKNLKYYSRLLLVNSGGQSTGNTTGSTTWWNYFGQIQYSPVQNLSIFLEFGNGGDSEWLSDNYASTASGKELERKLVFRFTYNI